MSIEPTVIVAVWHWLAKSEAVKELEGRGYEVYLDSAV